MHLTFFFLQHFQCKSKNTENFQGCHFYSDRRISAFLFLLWAADWIISLFLSKLAGEKILHIHNQPGEYPMQGCLWSRKSEDLRLTKSKNSGFFLVDRFLENFDFLFAIKKGEGENYFFLTFREGKINKFFKFYCYQLPLVLFTTAG